ncbi:MAG: ribosome maturation factor RimP [Actinomycetota bacterium]
MAEGETLVFERVRSLAEPVLAKHGAELLDLEVKRGRTHLLRLTVDRDDGIDLETCARVSRELSRLLDAEDPIPGRYTLEVTSPGADRPMRAARDFRRHVGRVARVAWDGTETEGPIAAVEDDRVKIGEQWIEYADIERAKLVLPW